MHVRPATPVDVAAVTAIYNHYIENTHFSFDNEPLGDRSEWFRQFSEQGPHRLFVTDDGGQVVGYAYSSGFRTRPGYVTSVETSIYLAPGLGGRGLGRPLYETLFAAIADEDLHRAYAGITLPNTESVAFHESLGFKQLGVYTEVGRKFGRYWDVAWYERPLP